MKTICWKCLSGNTQKFIAAIFTAGSISLSIALSGCTGNPFSIDQEATAPPEEETLAKETAVSTSTVKLSVTSDGHGVTLPSGTVAREPGAYNWITAAPKMGYEFSNWTVTAGSVTFGNAREATARVKLGSVNATVKAVFKPVNPKVYKLTMINDGHGKTTPGGPVNLGQTIYIGATPASGYVFSCWTVTTGKATLAKQTNGYWTVKLVNGNATVKANFKRGR